MQAVFQGLYTNMSADEDTVNMSRVYLPQHCLKSTGFLADLVFSNSETPPQTDLIIPTLKNEFLCSFHSKV